MYEIQSFAEFCAKNNVELLPEDLRFLKSKLARIPSAELKAILGAYYKHWCKGIGQAQKSHQKQNLGRFMANKALREYVDGLK